MHFATLAPIAIAVATALATAQTVDLNQWTVEHINGAGPWNVDAARLFCNSTNTVNTDVSTFYSDFQVAFLEFRMRIDPAGGDDDIAGFLLGWTPGDAANPTTADYLVVDWKAVTQTFQNWGTSVAGLALSRMQGQFTLGAGNAPIDLWSHTLNCTELARGANYGNVGWVWGADYHFRVLFTPNQVQIYLNGALEFDVLGTFNPGRFACYNFSQSRTEFQFPAPGAFAAYGSGCAGTGGTPHLFAPTAPYVGESLPIIVADVPTVSIVFLALGLSDTAWGAAPLPLNLAAFGAPGCALHASPDVLLAMDNFAGTAFLFLDLPATLAPTTMPAFFVQALATDFATNPLGFVFSNGGALTLGIR